MRIGTLALAVIVLSFIGCAHSENRFPAPCGANDYIEIPTGGKIADVPLPTDENKKYTIVTGKPGFWISLDCDNRIGR